MMKVFDEYMEMCGLSRDDVKELAEEAHKHAETEGDEVTGLKHLCDTVYERITRHYKVPLGKDGLEDLSRGMVAAYYFGHESGHICSNNHAPKRDMAVVLLDAVTTASLKRIFETEDTLSEGAKKVIKGLIETYTAKVKTQK